MLGGNNSNSVLPISLGENHFHGEVNTLPQLQLFVDNPVECIGGLINHIKNEPITTMRRPAKRSRDAESISRQQKHHMTLNNNFHQYEAGQLGYVFDPNLVSNGLKLSYEEEERNSSVTYDHNTAVHPMFLSVGDSLMAEMDRQKEEFDHHIRQQEENMIKDVREVGQRHMMSFLSAIETGIGSKLHEKELERQNMNQKNNELVERIKQISTKVQSWQCRAKYNESVVNDLKSNLKQVISQNIREGSGDSEVDNVASYANHKGFMEANLICSKRQMTCRACATKEASILLLPCRHLCLCKDCARFIYACPICQIMKTASIEVFITMPSRQISQHL